MLDKKLLIGIVLLFGGFTLMVQEIVLAPYVGLAIMVIGLYLVLDNIK